MYNTGLVSTDRGYRPVLQIRNKTITRVDKIQNVDTAKPKTTPTLTNHPQTNQTLTHQQKRRIRIHTQNHSKENTVPFPKTIDIHPKELEQNNTTDKKPTETYQRVTTDKHTYGSNASKTNIPGTRSDSFLHLGGKATSLRRLQKLRKIGIAHIVAKVAHDDDHSQQTVVTE